MMRLVRFLRRSYIDDTLFEAGTVALIHARHFLASHMEDVATGQTPGVPPAGGEHEPLFLDHTNIHVGRNTPPEAMAPRAEPVPDPSPQD